MRGRLICVLCVCLIVPMTTGLTCLTCKGHRKITGHDDCVDGITSSYGIETCNVAPEGQEARCGFIYAVVAEGPFPEIVEAKTECSGSLLVGIALTHLLKCHFAFRGCQNVSSSTPNKCMASVNNTVWKTLTARSLHECYCDTDSCNGQTTLVSSIFISLLGLVIYTIA